MSAHVWPFNAFWWVCGVDVGLGGVRRAWGRSMRVRHSDPYQPLPHLHQGTPSTMEE